MRSRTQLQIGDEIEVVSSKYGHEYNLLGIFFVAGKSQDGHDVKVARDRRDARDGDWDYFVPEDRCHVVEEVVQ